MWLPLRVFEPLASVFVSKFRISNPPTSTTTTTSTRSKTISQDFETGISSGQAGMYYSYQGCSFNNIQRRQSNECQEMSSEDGDEGSWVQMAICYAPQVVFNLYDGKGCGEKRCDDEERPSAKRKASKLVALLLVVRSTLFITRRPLGSSSFARSP